MCWKAKKIFCYQVKIMNYDVMINQHPNTSTEFRSWQICDSERILCSAGLSTAGPYTICGIKWAVHTAAAAKIFRTWVHGTEQCCWIPWPSSSEGTGGSPDECHQLMLMEWTALYQNLYQFLQSVLLWCPSSLGVGLSTHTAQPSRESRAHKAVTEAVFR